jgi:hypothetical protein
VAVAKTFILPTKTRKRRNLNWESRLKVVQRTKST